MSAPSLLAAHSAAVAGLRDAHRLTEQHLQRLELLGSRLALLESQAASKRHEGELFAAYVAAGQPHTGFVTADGITRLPPEIVTAIGAGDVVWTHYPDKPGVYTMITAAAMFAAKGGDEAAGEE